MTDPYPLFPVHGYLDHGPGSAEVARYAPKIAKAFAEGTAFRDVVPGGGNLYQYVNIPKVPLISSVWGGHVRTAQSVGNMVAASLIAYARHDREQRRPTWQYGHFITAILPNEIRKVMENKGNPGACYRQFEQDVRRVPWAMQTSVTETTPSGWCLARGYFPREGPGKGVDPNANCSLILSCTENREGNPIGVSPPEALPPPPADTPALPLPTPDEIDARARDRVTQEQAEELEIRLGLEGQQMLVAWATLLDALGLPPDSTLQEATAAMLAMGIEPTEAVEWLVACRYTADGFNLDAVTCFRRRAVEAIYAQQQYQAAFKTGQVVVWGALGALALAGYAWWRQR